MAEVFLCAELDVQSHLRYILWTRNKSHNAQSPVLSMDHKLCHQLSLSIVEDIMGLWLSLNLTQVSIFRTRSFRFSKASSKFNVEVTKKYFYKLYLVARRMNIFWMKTRNSSIHFSWRKMHVLWPSLLISHRRRAEQNICTHNLWFLCTLGSGRNLCCDLSIMWNILFL